MEQKEHIHTQKALRNNIIFNPCALLRLVDMKPEVIVTYHTAVLIINMSNKYNLVLYAQSASVVISG